MDFYKTKAKAKVGRALFQDSKNAWSRESSWYHNSIRRFRDKYKSSHLGGNNQRYKVLGSQEQNQELFKMNPELAADTLPSLFVDIWEKEKLPKDWTLGTIVGIPNKESLADWNDWRSVTLLSIPSRVLCKVIITRIENVVDTTLRKEQVGFRRGRGKTEHLFTLSRILEQCNKWPRIIYISNFVDFEKALDSVHGGNLSKTLGHYRISADFTKIISQFYNTVSCCIQSSVIWASLQTQVHAKYVYKCLPCCS